MRGGSGDGVRRKSHICSLLLNRRSGGGSAAATSPGSGCRGRAGALTVAGAPRARAACGQQEAAAAACGLFPPFINPAQDTDSGRGGTRLSDRRVLRRVRRQKENKRARWSEPLVLRPRLDSGGELRWAGRCGGRAGAGGPQTGRPARRRAWGAGQLQGTRLWALVKESPGWRPSSQGHLQASWAALRGSLSAAPRRRAPVSACARGTTVKQDHSPRTRPFKSHCCCCC